MTSSALFIVAGGVLFYALVANRAFAGRVSAPMTFTGFGLLFGAGGLSWIDVSLSASAIATLAEITLILALFSDAASIDVSRFSQQHVIPIRLLLVGLPLTVVLGTLLAAFVLPDLPLLQLLLLAVMLAPTDAALGQTVVSDPDLPPRIRQALNVESGLNDGLAYPALLIAAALALGSDQAVENRDLLGWSAFVASQLLLGPASGVLVGLLGARAMNASKADGRISASFLRLATIALPFLAYGAAETLGGNGFLAAFACGLTVGALSKSVWEGIEDFAAAEGQLLGLFVFLLLGASLLPSIASELHWTHLVYALLSLTVVRMVPVALSLMGLGLQPSTLLFIGWFGPRGLASIIYLLLVVDDHPGGNLDAVASVVLLTVALSIVLHGISASLLSPLYAKRVAPDGPEMAAAEPVSMKRPRIGADDEG